MNSCVCILMKYWFPPPSPCACVPGCRVKLPVAGEALGQLDGSVVGPVQLLHDEGEVRVQVRRRSEAPEQGRNVHQNRHQQQDVGEKLESGKNKQKEVYLRRKTRERGTKQTKGSLFEGKN